MHNAAKYASSPARSASLAAPPTSPLGSSARPMMAFGSRLTMGLSSLSGVLGKVPPGSGVSVDRHRKGLKPYAYREETQSMRAWSGPRRSRARSELAADGAAMTRRRRRPHAAAAPL